MSPKPAISNDDWIAILRNPEMRAGHLQATVRRAREDIARALKHLDRRESGVARGILYEQSVALARVLALIEKADGP